MEIPRIQQIGVLNDYEARLTGERRVVAPKAIPVMAYDNDHYDRWHRWTQENTLGDKSLYTLHTVNGNNVPIRWLVTVAETAQLIEGLAEHGIHPPREWKLMAPLYINSVCNNGNPDQALQKALQMELVAQRYIADFHPQTASLVGLPVLKTDNPDWVYPLQRYGRQIVPHLPSSVQDVLLAMTNNHHNHEEEPESNNHDPLEERAATYLLAHYSAYGLVNGHFPSGFNHSDALFVLPQSEDRFLSLVTESREAVEALGIKVGDFDAQNIGIMVSPTLRTPHYYPHTGEPLISDLVHEQRWPTENRVRHTRGLNGYAQEEIIRSLALLETDMGGKQQIGKLVKIVREVL